MGRETGILPYKNGRLHSSLQLNPPTVPDKSSTTQEMSRTTLWPDVEWRSRGALPLCRLLASTEDGAVADDLN